MTKAAAMLKILKGRGTPAVWLMRRLWVADYRPSGSPVRLSLPWHGTSSWDELHAYVTAVFMENTVPNASRAGYGTDQEQAESFARGILLSVCHRLGIEPVGAFDFHDPDHQEKDD